jgi:coatomer subunit delta
MPRSRIESLLTSFPKLIPANTQHTSVETLDVRYVYQPLEELYILLITNKASNILQDIETLHLFARVVSDLCRSAEEREISRHAFELLGAFDEIVSLGWREQINLMQVKSVLEMESHEEKIQDIISRVCFSPSSYCRTLSRRNCRTRKQRQRRSSNAVRNSSRYSAANNRNVLVPTLASSLPRISLLVIRHYLGLNPVRQTTRAARVPPRRPFARLHSRARV